MPLALVDTYGREGRIEDDLSVTYPWDDGLAESIEAFIEEVEADAESAEEVFETLLVELLSECDLREVRRLEG